MSVFGTEKTIETTEWADVQYKFGNKVGPYADAAKEQAIFEQRQIKPHLESAQNEILADYQNELNRRKEHEDDLREQSDEEDDEEAELQRLRQQRMQQLQQKSTVPQFGALRSITKDDYVKQVNEAGKGVWVVLVMYKQGHSDSEKLLTVIKEIAPIHIEVKFLQALASDISPTIPEKQLPISLLYKDGTMAKQVTGLNEWGGPKMEKADATHQLRIWKVLPKED
jgi:hypothetical protein